MKTIVLWAFLLGTVRCGDYSEIPKCAADPRHITLKISCNQSGHWEAQVHLEHSDVEEDVAASDQTFTPVCNGYGSVSFVANIAVPPQGNVVKAQFRKRIPEGYIQFSERRYFKAYKERVTWLEAKAVCEKEGAYLAGINSEAESRFLAAMWPPTHDWTYVGYHDLYEEGNFVTMYNQSIRGAQYPKWAGGEPNGKDNENCGVVRPNMLLIDIKCTDKNTFFCEFEY